MTKKKLSKQTATEISQGNHKKNKKPDFRPDFANNMHIKISKRKYEIYLLVTKEFMCQRQVVDRLGIRKQTINEHVKDLEYLGLIKPIEKHTAPKFYKSTSITPFKSGFSGKLATPVISADSRKMERTLSKKPIVVKDKKSGKIKHWRKHKITLQNRNYDTLVSMVGKRVRLCRVHGVAYTCTIMHGVTQDVPWKPVKKGMRGLEQYDLKINVPMIGKTTFRRQVGKASDELIIYLPEKYFFEWELEQGKKLLEQAVWKARKWFQTKYKVFLSLPMQYRRPEYAFEIFEPKIRHFVHEKGTVKVETVDGMAMADESKKTYPEVEFPTVEQAKAYIQAPDRIIRVETSLSLLIEQVTKMAKSQEEFAEQVQQIIGLRKEIDKIKEKESHEKMFS